MGLVEAINSATASSVAGMKVTPSTSGPLADDQVGALGTRPMTGRPGPGSSAGVRSRPARRVREVGGLVRLLRMAHAAARVMAATRSRRTL